MSDGNRPASPCVWGNLGLILGADDKARHNAVVLFVKCCTGTFVKETKEKDSLEQCLDLAMCLTTP